MEGRSWVKSIKNVQIHLGGAWEAQVMRAVPIHAPPHLETIQ